MINGLEQQTVMLERHMNVLKAVIEEEPIGIHNLSEATGIPNHRVRYSLRKLQEYGVIEPTHRGARLTGAAESYLADQDERLDTVIEQLEAMKPIHED